MTINDLETKCEPFKRIEMVLNAYNQLMDTTRQVEIFDIIQNKGKYDHQQLFDDFMHVKIIHIDADNDKIRSHDNNENNNKNKEDKNDDNNENKNKNGYIGIGPKICNYFQNKFRCDSMIQCRGYTRHYKDRIKKTENMEQTYCTEDKA
eukprot:531046_1